MTTKKTEGFENNIAKLEQIIAQLESGSLPLNKSMELYRQGQLICSNCQKIIDDAEQLIIKLEKTQDNL